MHRQQQTKTVCSNNNKKIEFAEICPAYIFYFKIHLMVTLAHLQMQKISFQIPAYKGMLE